MTGINNQIIETRSGRNPMLVTFFRLVTFIYIVTGFVSFAQAQSSWPLDADWIIARDSDWNPLGDPVENFQSGIEFIPDPTDGTSAYLYSTEDYIFFRLVLQGDPSKKTGDDKFLAYAWYVSIDVDNDNIPDWSIVLEGFNVDRLATWYNATGGTNNIPDQMNWSVSTPKPSGWARVTLPNGNNGMAYLDLQAPYTAFQSGSYSKTVTSKTAIRFFFTTTTTAQLTNIKDILSPSGYTDINQIMTNSMTIQLDQPDAYGFVTDTRESTAAISTDGGTWFRNETVQLEGFGWPSSTSPFYNASGYGIRIKDPLDQSVWSGNLTTDASGNITAFNSFTLPADADSGIYAIEVQSPLDGLSWVLYDHFTVKIPEPDITLFVDSPTATTGQTLTYTLTIRNFGEAPASVTTVTDSLPGDFTYVNSTSSGFTSSDPSITDDILTWSGNWTIAANDSIVLTFQVIADGGGTNYASASASGSNFTTVYSGDTAPVSVVGPHIQNYINTSTDTVNTGGTVSYTLAIYNTGTSEATVTTITDSLPTTFSFISGSVTGGISTDPAVDSNELVWNGSWSVAAGDSLVFSFDATAGTLRGLFTSIFYTEGSNFSIKNSGHGASVKVQGPQLQISKVVNSSTASPTDSLTYNTVYSNVGDGIANQIQIIEVIPDHTVYIPGSATADNATFLYSHDGGATFDSSDALPVTHIQIIRQTALSPGESGSAAFMVVVN